MVTQLLQWVVGLEQQEAGRLSILKANVAVNVPSHWSRVRVCINRKFWRMHPCDTVHCAVQWVYRNKMYPWKPCKSLLTHSIHTLNMWSWGQCERMHTNKSRHDDNLISVDDLWANVYFRMHCTFAYNLSAELHLLRDRYSVNQHHGDY